MKKNLIIFIVRVKTQRTKLIGKIKQTSQNWFDDTYRIMIASRFTNFATVAYYFIRILDTLQAIVQFTLD